jgi:hypothetical protein
MKLLTQFDPTAKNKKMSLQVLANGIEQFKRCLVEILVHWPLVLQNKRPTPKKKKKKSSNKVS